MPSTYSTSLRLELMATGEKTNTWGDITNTNLGTLLESSIAGVASVTHDDSASYSLTSSNGADDEARHMILEIGGTLTAARNVVCPTVQKLYFVYNNTTGGFDITIKTSGGTGITVPNGQKRIVYCDGTNVVDAVTGFAGSRFDATNAISLDVHQSLTGSDNSVAVSVEPSWNTTGITTALYVGPSNQASNSLSTFILCEDVFGSTTTYFALYTDGSTRFVDGSASTPVLSFLNDGDTGFYRSAANTIGVAAGGSSIGTLGSGGISFTKNLSVSGTNATINAVDPTGGAGGIMQQATYFYVRAGVASSGIIFDFSDGTSPITNIRVRRPSGLEHLISTPNTTGATTTANGTLAVTVGSTTYHLLTAASA